LLNFHWHNAFLATFLLAYTSRWYIVQLLLLLLLLSSFSSQPQDRVRTPRQQHQLLFSLVQ
jgi:hypothetical protein